MEERPIVSNKELNSYNLSPLHQNIRHLRIYTNNHYETSIGDFMLTLVTKEITE